MLVFSRYTPDGTYPKFAATLKASCIKHGISHDIQEAYPAPGRTSKDSWQRTMYTFTQQLLMAVITHRQPICWMDCDCEIIERPDLLLNTTADFATYNVHADPQNVHGIAFNPNRLLNCGGVLYFNYSTPAIELMLRWIFGCNASLDHHNKNLEGVLTPWDQILDAAYNSERIPLTPLWLPKSYNRMTTHFPEVAPIINHIFTDGGHKEEKAVLQSPQLKCHRCEKMVAYDQVDNEDASDGIGSMPVCRECKPLKAPPLRGVQMTVGAGV